MADQWFDPDTIRGDIESTLTSSLPNYGFIYENVPATLTPEPTIRIQISWGETTDESISCPDGSLRSITGTLSTWVYTPKNQGTSKGLVAAMDLRSLYMQWNRLGDCGQQVRISSVNGPRAGGAATGDDFYVHVLTATLTAMERVSYLR